MTVLVALVLAACGAVVGVRLRGWAATGAYRRPGDHVRRDRPPAWLLPLCALAPPALWAAQTGRGHTLLGLVVALAAWWGAALAVVDLDVHRLPDWLQLPAYPLLAGALAVIAAAEADPHPLRRSLVAAALVLAMASVLWLAAPRHGLGLGDVKLAGLLAALLAQLGWSQVVLGLWLGLAIAGVVALGLLVTGRAGRRDHLALGPALLLGALVTMLVG